MPMGPFRVADMSGLDTVVKVARDMRDAYGDRFYVHQGMEELVERGDLGAKTGKGFYEHAETTPQLDERIAERFQLKAFVEACLVLEEGVAGVRDDRPRDDDGHRHGPRARSRAPTCAGSTTCSPRSSRPRRSGASTSSRR